MAVAEQTLPMPVKKAQVSQSYWGLVWWKFKRNRVALLGGTTPALLYFGMGVVPEFVAPYALERSSQSTEAGPMQVHLFDEFGRVPRPVCLWAREEDRPGQAHARVHRRQDQGVAARAVCARRQLSAVGLHPDEYPHVRRREFRPGCPVFRHGHRRPGPRLVRAHHRWRPAVAADRSAGSVDAAVLRHDPGRRLGSRRRRDRPGHPARDRVPGAIPEIPLFMALAGGHPDLLVADRRVLHADPDPLVCALGRPGAAGARHDPVAARARVRAGGKQAPARPTRASCSGI